MRVHLTRPLFKPIPFRDRSVRRLIRPLAKSALFGGLAGAAPLLMLTFPLGIYSLVNGSPIAGLLPSLGIAVLPLVVAVPVIFVAMLVFGIPLTLLLKRCRLERASVYTAFGAVLGLLLFAAFLIMFGRPSGYWMALLGAVGGGVTGRTWWVYARQSNVRY